MKILDKIKALRKFKELTQKTMGEKLHLSKAAYNKIENGDTNLTMQRLAQIAEILGVDAQDLSNNNPITIVFSQTQANGVINNDQKDFIDYLKNQIADQRQEIEDKNLLIQNLKQELKELKQAPQQK